MPDRPAILALDTSQSRCSAALALPDGRTFARSEDVGHGHSRRLLAMVHELLGEAGRPLAAFDAIAFGAGPGGFTGLRIACGITQGLAFGAGLPVIPVDCLAAVAVGAAVRQGVADLDVGVLLDARMNECYFAVHRVRGGLSDGAVPGLAAPADAVAALLAHPSSPGTLAGNGLSLVEAPGNRVCLPDEAVHALHVARLGAAAFLAGRARPAHEARPLYVRDKVALDVDEQRALRAAREAAR